MSKATINRKLLQIINHSRVPEKKKIEKGISLKNSGNVQLFGFISFLALLAIILCSKFYFRFFFSYAVVVPRRNYAINYEEKLQNTEKFQFLFQNVIHF